MDRRNWKQLLRHMFSPKPVSRSRGLLVESLEDRVNPVSIAVSTSEDVLNFPSTSEGPFSLRDAIVYANGFGEQNLILVPEGTYTLTRGGTNEDGSLTGDLDIVANGGWIEIHGAGADKTIIDAAGIDRVFDVLPGAKLFVFNATIRGGFAENGGGIQTRGQLAVHYSIISGNTATQRGGGIDVNGSIQFASQETLYENNFAGTSASGLGLGGAINNGGGTIQINDAVFRNNRTGTLGSGGAVYSRSGLFIAITSDFEQNRAGMGGAVATIGGNANLVESTFTGNRAEFSGATAAPMGGAVFGQGEVYVERSTFTLNEAIGGGRGGAVANTNYMEVVNSTISGNKAGATGQYGTGAGIFNSGSFKLIHSTVVLNNTQGGGFGDGVLNSASAAAFTIFNTIVARNGSIPGNNGPDTYGGYTSAGGNLIGVQAGSNGWGSSDQVGTSFAPINPRIGPLQNNGGPTATHALRLDSRAIDRGAGGINLGYTGGVDQRNLGRVVNSVPDVGAYELQPRTNDAPVGIEDRYSVAEEGTLTVLVANGILANDTDADGDILDAEIVSWPSYGSFTIFSDGSFTYRPGTNFHGTDSFTYKAFDGALRSEPTTVTITVDPVNDPPVAKNDSYSLDEDTTLLIPLPGTTGVLGNDTDVDGDTLSAQLVNGPQHGTLNLNPNGSFTYTPHENYNGLDSFTYKAFDGTALSASAATVSLTIRTVNDAPVATQGLEFSTNEEQVLNGQVTATDVDGNPLTYSVAASPTWGNLNLGTNGVFTYTPFVNFFGGDTFIFRVSDGQLSDTARVVIVVNNVNDAPVAYPVNVYMDEDTSVADRVFNGIDIDGDVLTYTVLPHDNPGDFTYTPDGKFSYVPPPDFNGTVVFTYKASDGKLESGESTVKFTVAPVNDAPVAMAGEDFAIDEAGAASFDGLGSFDVDGDSLTYSWDYGDGGQASGATPSHTYPESGTYTVTLTISDGAVSSSDTLTLTVRNLAPTVTVSGPGTSVPGQSVTFSFSASDPSPGDTAAGFSYLIAWGDGQSETLSGPAAGITRSHTYSATGNRTVTVTATDRNAGTGPPATRGIAVSAANLQNGSLFIGGTTGVDTIDVRPANTTGGLAVTVNGSAVGTFAPTADVVVFGQTGDDTLSVSTAKIGKSTVSVARPVFLFGGDGNDTITATGTGAGVVAVGGLDSDSITGGSGRDILIGGAGTDTVRGGDGEDILIGGFTGFDGDLTALRALRAEWVRTDLAFAGRVSHLRGSAGGLNQSWFLAPGTVNDDDATDTLYGEGGTDWFFARKTTTNDVLPDDKKSEEFTWL